MVNFVEKLISKSNVCFLASIIWNSKCSVFMQGNCLYLSILLLIPVWFVAMLCMLYMPVVVMVTDICRLVAH